MNMDKMSSEERMKNLYNGKRIDRVPFMSSATMYAGKMMGYTSEEFYFDVKKSYQAQKWVREMHQCDGSPCFDIPNREVLDFQGELVFKKKYTLELPQVIYPVQTISEAEKFHLPSKSRWENLHKNIEFYEYAKSQGETSFGISAGSPLSMVGSMVDASHLLRWMCKEPRIVHKLLQQAETYLLDYAESIINTFGLENCYVYSDMPFESNDLISPKQFREFGFRNVFQWRKNYINICRSCNCRNSIRKLWNDANFLYCSCSVCSRNSCMGYFARNIEKK